MTDMCNTQHGDWTGEHRRVSSCPSEELGTAGAMIVAIMEHNARQADWISNQLYNSERRQRLALEMWIGDFQLALGRAHGGTFREYDAVMQAYDCPPMGYEEELAYAMRHSEWTEPLGG